MANLFNRLKNSITSDVHEMLDEKEKKNPISMLNQYLRQCETEVEKVRKLVERQYLLKQEFTKKFEETRKLADKRKHQADIASNAGETELYQFAMSEHENLNNRAERLQASLKEAENGLDELERKYEEMKHKLKDMYIKRLELMGRENIARANHRMNKVLQSSEGYSDASFSRFEEMEAYLERLEHGVNTSYYRSSIDGRIAQLEKEMKIEETHSISQ
ncbi:PspA/IM30 family protein [Rossellomorea vietnamensis]|uniref:PspA/IM30 family protein n=1 Tax=Rossellomorea aquimaris TaxID=189382 RepID=A0A5D4U1A7_9BACI|nr:PspA/IM30 family protein [Rossellomorea aquimaris]TYS80981.1 PspA/IM30 family protein [Rossellomorea aquimaris]